MALWSGDGLAAPHVPGHRGEPQARQVLAQALGADPETLPLVRDDKGRPELSGALAHYGTGWSHSGEVLLVALGEGVRLGVDLELLRPRARLLEIVQRFFHPEEVAWLESLDQADREHWFFRVWCAKEAMLKAHGQGISFGLHRLQLAPGPMAPCTCAGATRNWARPRAGTCTNGRPPVSSGRRWPGIRTEAGNQRAKPAIMPA